MYLEKLNVGNNQDKFNMHKNVHTSMRSAAGAKLSTWYDYDNVKAN